VSRATRASGSDVIFTETKLDDVVVIDVEPIEDERGFFARSWCAREFSGHGLPTSFVQENIGFNERRGTLRGIHYQASPYSEAKLVRCTAGSVWDVAVDLRQTSKTYCQWVGVELSADNRRMLFVPEGCGHGYISLGDGAEIRYLASQFYAPEAAGGARYDDPAFAIEWPIEPALVSEQDRSWPLLQAAGARGAAS
jgi:dTDP-4-dehydrorhamnose 3,5-epimerase